MRKSPMCFIVQEIMEPFCFPPLNYVKLLFENIVKPNMKTLYKGTQALFLLSFQLIQS